MTDRAPRIFDNNIVLDFPVPPLDVRQRIVSAAFLNAAACCEARLARSRADPRLKAREKRFRIAQKRNVIGLLPF